MGGLTSETLAVDAGFTTRTKNCFLNVFPDATLGHIALLEDRHLLRIENFGKVSLAEVKSLLVKVGLKNPPVFEVSDDIALRIAAIIDPNAFELLGHGLGRRTIALNKAATILAILK